MFFWRRTWSNSTHTSKKGAANSPDMVKLFENPGKIWYLVNFCPSLLQPHPTEVALSPAHIYLKSSDICKPLGRFLKELLVASCVYGCMGFLRHPRCMGTGSAHTLQEDKGGWRARTRTINTMTLATTASFVASIQVPHAEKNWRMSTCSFKITFLHFESVGYGVPGMKLMANNVGWQAIGWMALGWRTA